MSDRISVFDGHNDVLFRLSLQQSEGVERGFIEGGHGGQMDLPRMREGGFVGGLFAIYPPSVMERDMLAMMQGQAYDLPLPPPLDWAEATRHTLKMAAIMLRLEREAKGAFRVCRTNADIRRALADDAIAAVMHIEGAEAIDADFHMLDVLHAAGLRSIGMVWSRPNIFGHGVPMRYPSSPDTGPGLTEHGRELVARCNALGILLDLSHLNEAGFWEVASLSDAPLVATHSNVHAICPHARNLTDRQFAAIRESNGLVGLNYAAAFLRPDGQMIADTGFDVVARHLDGMIERLGEDRVGLGSDFDGAVIPDAIGDVAGLPRLLAYLSAHGYGDALVRKIASDNWLALLERTLKD
jgi:membrane dipeptidase